MNRWHNILNFILKNHALTNMNYTNGCLTHSNAFLWLLESVLIGQFDRAKENKPLNNHFELKSLIIDIINSNSAKKKNLVGSKVCKKIILKKLWTLNPASLHHLEVGNWTKAMNWSFRTWVKQTYKQLV